jgi:hypothetical protein
VNKMIDPKYLDVNNKHLNYKTLFKVNNFLGRNVRPDTPELALRFFYLNPLEHLKDAVQILGELKLHYTFMNNQTELWVHNPDLTYATKTKLVNHETFAKALQYAVTQYLILQLELKIEADQNNHY